MTEALNILVSLLLSKCTFLSGKEASTGEDISWLPISELSEYHIGLSDKGCWVVEAREGLILLNRSNSFGYLLSLLEISRAEIIRRLLKFSNSIGPDVSIVAVFPFKEIIKAGFNQGSDYWAELAFAWYDDLGDIEKRELTEVLPGVISAKWASQKVRQKAKRELKLSG